MKWNPRRYAAFASVRLRPATDLLARVKLSSSSPSIVDLGCGGGGPSRLLLKQWPQASLRCVDASEPMLGAARDALRSEGSRVTFAKEDFDVFVAQQLPADLIFSNAALHWAPDILGLLTRLMSLVRPGGTLAMQIPDTRSQPSHLLMGEVAEELGCHMAGVIPTNRLEPAAYLDSLGPLSHEGQVDMWHGCYAQLLQGPEPVWRYVRASAMLPVLEALGGEGSEAANAFERIYRERAAKAYPRRADGGTIFPFSRFFLVANRGDLNDIYSEYAAYHNHQLDKGWKS